MKVKILRPAGRILIPETKKRTSVYTRFCLPEVYNVEKSAQQIENYPCAERGKLKIMFPRRRYRAPESFTNYYFN